MNNSKIDRRLRSLWYKKDIKGWIEFKLKMGRFSKGLTSDSEIFMKQMEIWNMQFTHEEERGKHHAYWNPYCCSNEQCSSGVMDRMEETPFGWRCTYCGLNIGKHLYRIPDKSKEIKILGWNNYDGLPIVG